MRRHAAAMLLLMYEARAGCEGNCAAPINVTCGSVLVVGDSTTDEYMPELRTLLSNLGVGHIYIAHAASDGPCGSSFGRFGFSRAKGGIWIWHSTTAHHPPSPTTHHTPTEGR